MPSHLCRVCAAIEEKSPLSRYLGDGLRARIKKIYAEAAVYIHTSYMCKYLGVLSAVWFLHTYIHTAVRPIVAKLRSYIPDRDRT